MRLGSCATNAAEAAIDETARARHLYVIGQTGTGKSVLLENCAVQDIQAGHGICFVDPHGQAARNLIDHIPEERKGDLIFIDLADTSHSVSLNFMTGIPTSQQRLHAENFVAGWRHVFQEIGWGARMQDTFTCSVQTLMEKELTLLALPRLFHDRDFRNKITAGLKDPYLRNVFWPVLYPAWSAQFRADLTSPIENKVSGILGSPALRNILSQPRNSFTIRDAMDSRKIIIVALAKGQIGEQSAALFGSLLVSYIAQAALSRDDIPESDRVPFALYADEFQNFATNGFPLILSESRKYALWLTLAHQGLSQLKDEIKDAVFENCGSYAAFRVGAQDAAILAKTFGLNTDSFLDLQNYQLWYRPLIEGVPGTPHIVKTDPPQGLLHAKRRELIAFSTRRFARPKEAVERDISSFLEAMRESHFAQQAQSRDVRPKAKAPRKGRTLKRGKGDPQ